MIVEEEKRDWSDIPVDVLVEIVGNLLFLDHLSFRAVCKAWRYALLQSPGPPQNHPKSQPHWLISFSKKSTSTWEFSDPSNGRLYPLDLPELTGIGRTNCFLSKHGWLLLAHLQPPSVFFFNPFSRAQIDLPWGNVVADGLSCYQEENKPAFAVSAPPTSPDCTVFALAYLDQYTFQITTCRRGADAWTSKKYKSKRPQFFPISSAVFSAGKLYWVDKSGILRSFMAEKGYWTRLRAFSDTHFFESFYSYLMEWDEQVIMCLCFQNSGRRYLGVLKSGEWAKMMELGKEEKQYLEESNGKAATDVPGLLRQYTFSIGGLCISCDSEDDYGHRLLSWHLWYGPGCRENCDHCNNSVWIQPQWINPSPTIAWTA